MEIAKDSQHAASDDVSLLPGVTVESGSALDSLLAELHPDAKPDAGAPSAPPAATTPPPSGTPEDEAAAAAKANAAKAKEAEEAAKKAADDAKKKADSGEGTIDDTIDAQRKADAEKAEEARKAEEAQKAAEAAKSNTPPPEKDAFDNINLPPNAKGKSSEAFSQLKTLARETAAALTKQLADEKAVAEKLKADLAEATAKAEAASKVVTPPEVEAELEDLRKFKLSKDVESDPTFKSFNTAIEKNTESIYRKLKESGLGEEALQKIKELGGPENVDWDPILPRLSLATRRFVEATLVDNERQRELRTEALEKAKENASAYLEERASREVSQLTQTANGYLKNLAWTAEKPIPATATAEERAALEAHNGFARESVAKLKAFLSDRSPARIAELAVGTLIAYRTKADLQAAEAKIAKLEADKTASTKELDDKLAAVTKERDKLAADLLAIRKAEVPRGGVSGSTLVTTPAKTGIADARSGADALDELANQAVGQED